VEQAPEVEAEQEPQVEAEQGQQDKAEQGLQVEAEQEQPDEAEVREQPRPLPEADGELGQGKLWKAQALVQLDGSSGKLGDPNGSSACT
jgi:hypothetical protein